MNEMEFLYQYDSEIIPSQTAKTKQATQPKHQQHDKRSIISARAWNLKMTCYFSRVLPFRVAIAAVKKQRWDECLVSYREASSRHAAASSGHMQSCVQAQW